MKKTIWFIMLLLLCEVSFASINTIANINPQFMYSTYPISSDSTPPRQYDDWYENYQDVYKRYFDQKDLIDLGLKLETNNLLSVVELNVGQDIVSYISTRIYSNVPYVGNSLLAVADMNFPYTAYAEYKKDNLKTSLGRRRIKWGPGNYDMAISDAAPFMDNFWLEYKLPAFKGTFGYNFVAVSFNTEALNKGLPDEEKNIKNKKTLLAHKFNLSYDHLKVSIGELNLIYGEYPNLIDISPFGIYHNLFQDSKSNVMLSISIDSLINLNNVQKLRLYGSFVMDDFDLPGEREKNNGKPAAIGYGVGFQLHVLNAKTVLEKKTKYLLEEETFKFNDGLNISYEFYFCSPYMYNRDVSTGKFTVPLKMYSVKKTIHETNAFFIGFQYGPNSTLHEIRADYVDGRINAGLTLGLLTRGDAYSIDSAYGKQAVLDGVIDYNYRFKLYGNKISTLLLSADCSVSIIRGITATGDFTGAYDFAHNKFAFQVGIGSKIDIPKLF